EADELQNHDERPGRRLGETEPVDRLRGCDPVEGLDRGLRHVRENRVGAAEGDEGRLGEEPELPGVKTLPAARGDEGEKGPNPEKDRGRGNLREAQPGAARGGDVLPALSFRRLGLPGGSGRGIPELPDPPGGVPADRGAEDDRREWDLQEI